MSPESVIADRVYRTLKVDILLGRHAPGSSLNVHAIAAELDLSVSPVRDALNRLIGERIVAVRAGGGFQIPNTDATTAGELYAWHGRLTSILSTRHAFDRDVDAVTDALQLTDESDPRAMANATVMFFDWFAGRSENVEHAQAIRSAGERLHSLRLREVGLPDRKHELLAMCRQIRDRQATELRRAIIAYHRLRIDRASSLVDLLFSPSFVISG